MKTPAMVALACLMVFCASLAEADTRVYNTRRATTVPRIDGRIDDRVWDTVEWSGDFLEHSPDEGEPPTGQTAFKVLYDDENIYMAFRAWDPEPEKIADILQRRDHFPGDWVEVNIDSYFDHRTAFSFTASVSGTQGDEFISDDGNNWDGNWDPIWRNQSRKDDKGWTAEISIPLSQLRYNGQADQTWGLQVQRRIHRNEERSLWQPISRDESGWVSKFGELRGISNLRAQRQIELLPYVVTQGDLYVEESGNPFADGADGKLSGGLDGKIGITSDMTMNFTINPDFGQVEADPSEVNLSAFETIFDEKRPFFIEGNNIFDFRIAPSIAYGTHTRDKLFYSRRIGRQPHYHADWYELGYVDQPDQSSILGAFKVTGKSAGGVTVGILESVTAKEEASIDENGQRRKVTVEPLTNYFAGRVQKDFRRGDTRVGGMLTAVNRDLDSPELTEMLHSGAYAGGVDFFHYLSERRYYLRANLVGSLVKGSRDAITRTQMAPARLYQRPDNTGQTLYTTATSLAGHAGSVMVGKPSGNFNLQSGVAWRSAGFELNDLGVVRNCDEINQFSWAGYNIRQPFNVFNSMSFNFNQWLDFEPGGENLYQAFNFNTNAQFRNNWSYNGSISRQNERISNWELRGGPSMLMPGDISTNFGVNSDGRKKISYGLGASGSWIDNDSGDSRSAWCYLSLRPTNAVRINLNPSVSRGRSQLQYVSTRTIESSGEDRYIYARIDRKTFNMSFRVDYSVTPNLTIQYYGSPYISAQGYSEYKSIVDPRAAEYEDRFESLEGVAVWSEDTQGNWAYRVDEDGDGLEEYSFGDRTGNSRFFNSNLVLRWQYSPGSSMFLVWSQSRADFAPTGEFALSSDLGDLFDSYSHNTFLFKVNRWLNL